MQFSTTTFVNKFLGPRFLAKESRYIYTIQYTYVYKSKQVHEPSVKRRIFSCWIVRHFFKMNKKLLDLKWGMYFRVKYEFHVQCELIGQKNSELLRQKKIISASNFFNFLSASDLQYSMLFIQMLGFKYVTCRTNKQFSKTRVFVFYLILWLMKTIRFNDDCRDDHSDGHDVGQWWCWVVKMVVKMP